MLYFDEQVVFRYYFYLLQNTVFIFDIYILFTQFSSVIC